MASVLELLDLCQAFQMAIIIMAAPTLSNWRMEHTPLDVKPDPASG